MNAPSPSLVSNLRNLLLFLAPLTLLLFALAGLGLGWPLWSWALLALVPLCLALGLGGGARSGASPGAAHRPGTEPGAAPTYGAGPARGWDVPPPCEPLYREWKITEVLLPSAVPDYEFLFSATVRWHFPPEHPAPSYAGDPGAVAAESVLEQARRFSEQVHPSRWSLLRHQLSAMLEQTHPVAGSAALAMARNVTLELRDEDRERLARLAALRKDETLWLEKISLERLQRAYFGDEVLKDTGSAVIWQLVTSKADVPETVDRIGLLAQLAAAANNAEVDEVFHPYLDPDGQGPSDPGTAGPSGPDFPHFGPAAPAANGWDPGQTGANGWYFNGTGLDGFPSGPRQDPGPEPDPDPEPDPAPDPEPDPEADLADSAIHVAELRPEGESEGAYGLFVEQLARRLRKSGNQEAADALRRHCAPAPGPSPAEPGPETAS